MSGYLGDFDSGCLVFDMFTTVTTTGAPTQLAGTPALSVYNDLNVTQTTAGITLAVDCDSVTGLNAWSVNTNSTAYDCGHDYKVVITTGTVGGVSVVGYVVGTFSLDNRSHVRPLIHGQHRVGVSSVGDVCANLVKINGSASGVPALQRSTDGIARITVGAGSSTTSVVTSACAPAGAVADQFKGRVVIFDANTTTAALRGQATDITASSNAATPTLTVTALTTAPSSGDTAVIV